MDIDSLYKAAKDNDEKAENELFRVLSVRLNIFACHTVRDREAARELVQGTLMKLVKHFREMEFDVSFSAWAYKVLRNDIMNYRQKQRRLNEQMNSLGRQQEIPLRTPDPALESRVIACLKEMIRKNRSFGRVLNLKYQGYGSDEIRLRLNISSSNLYVILYRARLAMMACLEGERPSDARV